MLLGSALQGSSLQGNALDPRQRRKSSTALTPEQEQSILQDMANMAGGAFSDLAWGLDTPGAGVRSALVGKDPLAGMLAGSDERTSGRDVLRHYGLIGGKDTWLNYLAGMGVEFATDPLLLVKGPATALTPAGKAAAKAGLIGSAGRSLSRKYVKGTGSLAPKAAAAAERSMARVTKNGKLLTESDLYANPLVTKRVAQKNATLDDVVRYADNPSQAEDAVISALGKGDALRGKKLFDELRNQRLSNDIGLMGVGTADLGAAGDAYRQILDAAGNKLRWSPVGRAYARAFDRKAGNAFDADLQQINIAAAMKGAARKEAATKTSVDALSALAQSSEADDIFSEEGNRLLGKLIEDDIADDAMGDLDPAVAKYLQWWKQAREDSLAESKSIGINADRLDDEFVKGYLPYQADPMFEMSSGGAQALRSELSTMTGDQLARGTTLRLPGGRDTIMRLSQDEVVSGASRTAKNDQEAAEYLAQEAFKMAYSQMPAKRQEQMQSLARLLHRLPKKATDKAALFGQHPTMQIQRYLEGRAVAQANMDAMLDGVVSNAVNTPARLAGSDLANGSSGFVSLKDALASIGGRSYDKGTAGAAQQVRERIAAATGRKADSIELSQYSVPRDFVDRLQRSHRAIVDPKDSSELVKTIDAFTQVWKASILSWPSRIVRDLYSGQFANWLVGATSVRGFNAAKALLAEGAGSGNAAKYVAMLPQYSGIADAAERARRFQADLAATGLMSGGAQLDRAATISGKSVLDQIPGQTRVTLGSTLRELGPQQGRSWTQYAKDYGGIPTQSSQYKDLTNPILRAGDMGNRLSDGINRLSGYYALLEKGYSPQAAAEQIKRVQIDYSDLSQFERSFARRIFPWYTYQSKIFREVLGQLVERPGGRYGQMMRGIERGQQEASDDGDYIPPWLRNRIAVPVSEGEDGTRYAANLDLPGIAQLQMLPQASRPNQFGQVMQQVAGQLAPQLRVPMELISQRDFYHDRPISESDDGLWSTVTRQVAGQPMSLLGVPAYAVDRVIGNVPFVQRPATFARKLLDDRGGKTFGRRLEEASLDALTGIKTPTVTPQMRDRALTSAIGESLSGLPQARTMTTTYIPEELEPYTPQWALDRLRLQRQRQRGPTRQ